MKRLLPTIFLFILAITSLILLGNFGKRVHSHDEQDNNGDGVSFSYDKIVIGNISANIDYSSRDVTHVTISYSIAGNHFVKTVKGDELPNISIGNNNVSQITFNSILSAIETDL